MDEKKIVRVEIFYNDGSSIFVEKKESLKWDEMVRSQGVMAYVHGQSFPTLKWKKAKPGTYKYV